MGRASWCVPIPWDVLGCPPVRGELDKVFVPHLICVFLRIQRFRFCKLRRFSDKITPGIGNGRESSRPYLALIGNVICFNFETSYLAKPLDVLGLRFGFHAYLWDIYLSTTNRLCKSDHSQVGSGWKRLHRVLHPSWRVYPSRRKSDRGSHRTTKFRANRPIMALTFFSNRLILPVIKIVFVYKCIVDVWADLVEDRLVLPYLLPNRPNGIHYRVCFSNVLPNPSESAEWIL